jgi:hypothetical protein
LTAERGPCQPPPMWWMRGLFIAGVLGGLAIIGGGVFQLVQDETGAGARATVSECHGVDTSKGTQHVTCTGSWVVGGSLTGNGHVVVGDISGANDSDVGKTLNVTVRNGTAYTRGLLVPIVLMGVGILVGGGSGFLGWVLWSPSPSDSTATG